jgi:transcription termination factor Rho
MVTPKKEPRELVRRIIKTPTDGPYSQYPSGYEEQLYRRRMARPVARGTPKMISGPRPTDPHPIIRRFTPPLPPQPKADIGVVDGRVLPDAGLPTETIDGFLDLESDGHGVLRPKYSPSDRDVYLSSSQIRRFNLREGDLIGGHARAPKENERLWGLLKVDSINGKPAEEAAVESRRDFETLTSIHPNARWTLEHGKEPLSDRIIDLFAPIGKGQRGLIVSPPKAGKTWLLRDIANGVTANYPDSHLMMVLIGERPEEVTEFSRTIKGEVVASNFDDAPELQVDVAMLALERAKRLVEDGKDVIILLDSITRFARALNMATRTSGRTLSGGYDPAALFPAKRFLGAARNLEEGGSLTIIGTALVDTGSRMDDLIYEEFKGTGTMELHLDRKLAELRIFPAINLLKSGTRQEELLYKPEEYEQIVRLHRIVGAMDEDERTELIVAALKRTATNKEFFESIAKGKI